MILKIKYFDLWAKEFTDTNDFEIPKGEGVSGLIRKKDWDEIGGNDSLFAPASWDDMDLFLRMLQSGFGVCFNYKITSLPFWC